MFSNIYHIIASRLLLFFTLGQIIYNKETGNSLILLTEKDSKPFIDRQKHKIFLKYVDILGPCSYLGMHSVRCARKQTTGNKNQV